MDTPFSIETTKVGEGDVSERVGEVREKVLNWLKEEGLSPEEMEDPNAYFNFNVNVGGRPFNVVQNVLSLDSICVTASLVFTPDQLTLLKHKMNKKKKKEYFWDLRLAMLKNSDVGDFDVKPDPPDDVREVFVCSRKIFYDALTKHKLLHAIHSAYKAYMMVIWMLERHAGQPFPKEKKTTLFAT
jgi:hypothetical protein